MSAVLFLARYSTASHHASFAAAKLNEKYSVHCTEHFSPHPGPCHASPPAGGDESGFSAKQKRASNLMLSFSKQYYL